MTMSDSKQTKEVKPPETPTSVCISPAPSTTPTLTPRERWANLGARSKEIISPMGQHSPRVKTNGSLVPDLKRTDSLTVPGRPKSPRKPKSDDKSSTGSRRSSSRSDDSRASNVDFSRLQSAPVVHAKKDEEDKTKTTVHNDDMYIRSVIPFLPQWLAVVCLMMNVTIPGSGTMLCGFSIFCCGHPRVQSKEDLRMITFCVNVMVGTMQLFTVPFMLVGWFWALVWGIYMLILAAEHKAEEKQRREKELQAKALTALNANLRPWTLMRS